MPKTPPQDKPNHPALGPGSRSHSRKISSIGELLSTHRLPRAVRAAQAALDAQAQWLARLRDILPAKLGAQISGVAEQRGTLVIYANSAEWCTRLKYALAGALPRCQEHAPGLRSLQVRVRPPGRPG
ncbi:MAG: DciA family protein [Steroidobacteraceae bacterium]